MNAYRLESLKAMGIDAATLGFVGLDVVPTIPLADFFPQEMAYRSDVLPHVAGIAQKYHVTLKYGLMQPAYAISPAIQEVLDGWSPPTEIQAGTIGIFPSPLPDELYDCLVLFPDRSEDLLDAHNRLSMLPHIDAHPTYRPHVTVGYFSHRWIESAAAILDSLVVRHGRIAFTPNKIILGDPPK